MPFVIHNQKSEKLAIEISAITGEDVETVVKKALEEKLERLLRQHKNVDVYESIMELSVYCSSLPDFDTRTPEEILDYNDFGAPE